MRRTLAGTNTTQEATISYSTSSTTQTVFNSQFNGMSAQDTFEIYVIASIYDNGSDETEQGNTECDVTSASPTPSPSDNPSSSPVAQPSGEPSATPTAGPLTTGQPTMSPTFRNFNISDCQVIINTGGDKFTATFTQPIYNYPALPIAANVRYVFTYRDDDDTNRYDDSYVGTGDGETFSQEITLEAGIDIDNGVTVHAAYGTLGSTEYLSDIADCNISTLSPTISPTTESPTPYPTYEPAVCYIDIDSIESSPACVNVSGIYECTIVESSTSAVDIGIIRKPDLFGESVSVLWEIEIESDETGTDSGDFVTSDDFIGSIPSGLETFDAFQTHNAYASFVVKQEDASSDQENTERFYFVLTGCSSTGGYNCSIGTPSEVLIYVTDVSDASNILNTTNTADSSNTLNTLSTSDILDSSDTLDTADSAVGHSEGGLPMLIGLPIAVAMHFYVLIK